MSETATRLTSVEDRPKPAAPQQKLAALQQKLAAAPSQSASRASGNGERAQQLADAAVHGVLARHWNILGLSPTMDLAELETSFYMIVERLSRNPTEEEEARLAEMQQSYAVLRRALEERPPVAGSRLDVPEIPRRQRIAACIAAGVGLLALSWLNFGTIKLHWTDLKPDTLVRLVGKHETYGTVIRFDPSHQFAVGPPARAYQLKLATSGEVVWLSERVVEKGMVPVK